MTPDDLFTRDEVLGGLPARRAAATLFLVESRAAHLADRSRRAADFLLSEGAERRRDLHFLEAFSGGREPPVKPGIHDLEQRSILSVLRLVVGVVVMLSSATCT